MFSSVMLMKSMFTLFISSVLHYSPLCHTCQWSYSFAYREREWHEILPHACEKEKCCSERRRCTKQIWSHTTQTQASVLDASCQHGRSSRATLWERSSGPGSCFSWQLLPVNHRCACVYVCVCVCVCTRPCSFLVWETSATFSAVQISLNLQAVKLRRGVMIFKKIYIFLWIKI